MLQGWLSMILKVLQIASCVMHGDADTRIIASTTQALRQLLKPI